MSGNNSGFSSYNPNTSSSGSGSGSGAGSSGTSSSAWKSNASEIRDVSKSFSSTASSSTDSKAVDKVKRSNLNVEDKNPSGRNLRKASQDSRANGNGTLFGSDNGSWGS
ncbi:hypothetical protein B0T13DRAFT_509577 [Neurospora crassa]|nr:hypothetical protein B0T13DRAFT_509577 [Neurospora crassa]